jgi:hypothetical protein
VLKRKLARELNILATSAHRILTIDLGCHAYKIIKEPAITEQQKADRKAFATWVLRNFRKEDNRKILFSNEKNFDIDGVYNSQNDRIWAVSRAEADKRGGVKKKRKFSAKVIVWLGACSKGLTPLVILNEGSVDHAKYIEQVLPIAKKYGNKMFGDDWTFQQDNATPHTHHLTQKWCSDNLPSFISKERWPANSPNFNPLDQGLQWQVYQAETKCTEHLLLAKYTLFYTSLRKTECTLYTLTKKITFFFRKLYVVLNLRLSIKISRL